MRFPWTFLIAWMLVTPSVVRGGPLPQRPLDQDQREVPPVAVPGADDPLPGTRSETSALVWSLAATAPALGVLALLGQGDDGGGEIVALVFTASVLVGPSAGHFYAGRTGRGLLGVGIRSAALIGLLGAIGMSWESQSTTADFLGLASIGVGIGSLVWDIASAPNSARIHNRDIREHALSLGVGPVNSSGSPGFILTAHF